MYYVYIIECADQTLYTGSTNDVAKRVAVHNEGKTGAKYTKTRRPVLLRYVEEFDEKGTAMSREWELKQLTREKKLELISSGRFTPLDK